MKLFNLAHTLGLVSIFYAFTSARITIGEMPYQVQVGEWYDVEYTSDRNYTLIDFRVMQWNENALGSWGTSEIVNYRVDIGAGHTLTSEWKVPNVENGVYDFFLNAVEVDEHGQWNPNTTFYVRSNKFEIVGGHAPLGPEEIAGITVGALAAVVLFACIWVVGARLWRQRRSLTVDLSGQNEGRYSDNAER